MTGFEWLWQFSTIVLITALATTRAAPLACPLPGSGSGEVQGLQQRLQPDPSMPWSLTEAYYTLHLLKRGSRSNQPQREQMLLTLGRSLAAYPAPQDTVATLLPPLYCRAGEQHKIGPLKSLSECTNWESNITLLPSWRLHAQVTPHEGQPVHEVNWSSHLRQRIGGGTPICVHSLTAPPPFTP